jgi:phage terminase large subunit GpA-like protein
MAVFRKIVKTDAWVNCPTCSCEILVAGARGLRREFFVPCPNCGRRTQHQLAELHDAKRDAEPIPPFGNIQFGTKNICIQPKSPLNQWVSWLLQ